MIVAIDGPAGAGKSTVTRLLAQKLDFKFLDTGAMYRAVTWAALERGIDLGDHQALRALAEEIEITFDDDKVFLNGTDVTVQIRSPEVTRHVSAIADAPTVREYLVMLQRRIAQHGDFVCEGRDQGTVAFPDAICKIYLTASSRCRALRRAQQMTDSGEVVNIEQLIREQDLRDHQDLNRAVGRLKKADDAIEFDTDSKTQEEVVSELVEIVQSRMSEISSRQ